MLDRGRYTGAMDWLNLGHYSLDGCWTTNKKQSNTVTWLSQAELLVECHTGDDVIDNYDETLREQRQMSADIHCWP